VADVYITGEISEPQAHYAREMGVAYIACGHHASERYGAPAVAAHVAQQLGLEHTFIDIDNPAYRYYFCMVVMGLTAPQSAPKNLDVPSKTMLSDLPLRTALIFMLLA
jgi:NIF3 (NGG1p interacting factor 3)